MSTENNEPVTVTTGDYYAEDDQNTVGEKHGKILGGLCDVSWICSIVF